MVNELTRRPILITGAHRSGTTWIGKILATSPDVAYISEPLNVLHRPGVLCVPIKYWYTYICEENQSSIFPAIRDTLQFRYHFWLELRSLRSIKDVGRMVRDIYRFKYGQLRSARPLIKDPFAVFSAPWFFQKLDCQVVIIVRHPFAFVSSLKRLNWNFNFEDFLVQPLLMRDYLEPFRDELLDQSGDIISQGGLLWRMIYTAVDRFRETYPEFTIIRHEDFSRQPEKEFSDLFATLGLSFSPNIRQVVINSSQDGNPDELSTHKIHAIKLDSQANLINWQKRLTEDDVRRIHNLTSDVSAKFYPEGSPE